MKMNDMKQLIDNRGEYEDFIGSYSNFIDSSLCKSIIDTFNYYHNIGAVFCGGEQFDNTCHGTPFLRFLVIMVVLTNNENKRYQIDMLAAM